MHSADHTWIEDLGLVQGTVLALILSGVVALFWDGQTLRSYASKVPFREYARDLKTQFYIVLAFKLYSNIIRATLIMVFERWALDDCLFQILETAVLFLLPKH